MKRIIEIIIICIILNTIINPPKYVELNNLIIINEIKLTCKNNNYQITLKEIIPKKDDAGINYEYKNYQTNYKNLDNLQKKIKKSINKTIYYKDTNKIITNCKTTDKLRKELNIKPKIIIHKKTSIK